MNSFLLSLAWRSAWNRRFTLLLTAASIALSTVTLLGVERIRTDLRDGFVSAVSGVDLIVGARTGSTQLLLYSVFHLGAATHNIRWSSVQALEQQRGVAWVVPLSLGDSHRGFSVVGTTVGYFEHLRHGEQRPLALQSGKVFDGLFDAVVGAEVAKQLGYRIGHNITLAHGTGELQLADHADKPFKLVGILKPTGTPVDRTVHISLEAMEALHVGWFSGAPMPGASRGTDAVSQLELAPKAVTAALVGLHNRAAVFSVQKSVNNFADEPLMAILPGVALDELWEIFGTAEKALALMSGLVAATAMAGLVSVILAGLNERRRELAVLRAVGAGPRHILMLLGLEGLIVTVFGVVLGVAFMALALVGAGPWLQSAYGLTVHLSQPTPVQWVLLAGLVSAGWLASLIPGYLAYRISLADGLSPKI